MNAVLVFLIAGAVLAAGFSGQMNGVARASFESAKTGVETAFGLLGTMVLWLGLMNILRDAGAIGAVARALQPLLQKLFPEVPAGHPALGAIVMNLAANIFGLGNAATPFGLKAMQELDRLNPRKGVATNSMALFLAINTSGVSVLPTGVMAIRSALGSADPGGIVVPTLLATAVNTVIAALAAIFFSRLSAFRPERFAATAGSAEAGSESSLAAGLPEPDPETVIESQPPPGGSQRARDIALGAGVLLGLAVLLESGRRAFGPGLQQGLLAGVLAPWGLDLSGLPGLSPAPSADGWFALPLALGAVLVDWLIPLLLAFIMLFGIARGVKVYESAIKGAREGFDIFVMVVPFLVIILVAVGVFRASGGLDLLLAVAAPLTSWAGFPPEALPMALIRPLSGSGAMGVMTETMKIYGPDSFVGYLVSVMNGTSETTFYVLAVYFGSVRVRAVRHTLLACLTADLAGIFAALFFTRILLF
jgi:spore maturation protein SpmA